MNPICQYCEYDLAGLTDDHKVKCPECGQLYEPLKFHPFPNTKSYLITLSIDWVRGLMVLIPLSTVLVFIVKWSSVIFVLPAFLILVVGLVVLAIKSRNRVLRITDASISVPKYAWSLYSIPTVLWFFIYWIAVLSPWYIVL